MFENEDLDKFKKTIEVYRKQIVTLKKCYEEINRVHDDESSYRSDNKFDFQVEIYQAGKALEGMIEFFSDEIYCLMMIKIEELSEAKK